MVNNEKFLIYCAGPMTGLSYDAIVCWHEYLMKKLPPKITILSPMRGKEYLADQESIKNVYEKHPLASQRGLTCRDRNDVMRCDLLLVNFLGAKQVSIGTIIEIGWADMLRKPIVIAMEPDNIHSHAMVRDAAGFIVPTLDEAIEIAILVLLTGL
ncbi:MAG: hypothetical protein HY602_00545 [Parcubacteria group bacterium]|nr:hypothetical protein [Parcubacteria group bacterium]